MLRLIENKLKIDISALSPLHLTKQSLKMQKSLQELYLILKKLHHDNENVLQTVHGNGKRLLKKINDDVELIQANLNSSLVDVICFSTL